MKMASNFMACAALALTGLAAAPLAPVLADPGNGEGAIIIDGVVCRIPVPNENGGFSGLSLIGEGDVVTTPSGNVKRRCHAEVPEALRPSRAIHRTDLHCLGPNIQDEGDITVTPSGQITAYCHRDPSND